MVEIVIISIDMVIPIKYLTSRFKWNPGKKSNFIFFGKKFRPENNYTEKSPIVICTLS